MLNRFLFLFFLVIGSAEAAYFPQVQVTQTTGTNLHVNVDNFAASQSVTANQLPPSLGQKTMSQSLSCTVASDQTALPVTGTFWQATQPVSAASLPLPSGAATSANQTTANTSLSSIDTKLTSVQTKAPVNVSATAVQQTVTTTASTITAPANVVGFILQNDSVSSDCVRWRIGSAASSIGGLILFPTDATPEVHSGANVSVAACSGTQTINLQWISQ